VPDLRDAVAVGALWDDRRVPLTVASVNVNGLRAAMRRGMGDWLTRTTPDIVTLQEVRASVEQCDDLLHTMAHGRTGVPWHVAHEVCAAKGRAGVSVLSAVPAAAHTARLGGSAYEDSGRWIEADFDTTDGRGLTVVSAYVHTGDARDAARMEEKLAFLRDGLARIGELRDAGRHVLLTGDLNVAHQEVDLCNWRGNLNKAGFHPTERAHFDRMFDELGWVDLGRMFAGDAPGPYTWWSYRGRAFDNDVGWRIDYQIASPGLAALAKDAVVHRAPTHPERWSDHAPVVVTFDLELAAPPRVDGGPPPR
jgi:exodeoxyribonuclease-3